MDERSLPGSMARATPTFDARTARTAGDLWHDVKSGLDFFAHNLPGPYRLLTRLNPYPSPWEKITLLAADGARLAACYGPGRPGGPAVLFAPGTFQTKDDTPRKRRALEMWRRFGAHVLIVDLRGFGGSHPHLGSAGYLEARDLHMAADWLRERSGRNRVTLWGESLGGACSLLAASLPDAERRFDRVLAWSPYADLADAARIASPTDPRGRSVPGVAYRWLLRARTGREIRDFEGFLKARAVSLGMSVDELLEHGSPVRHVSDLRVPAYVYHAEDDPIVPVDHARMLARHQQEGSLQVEILPRGAHLDFDRVAPAWFRAVTREHLEGAA